MRAVIPAFILLFIGLVAAIPFRRPPADLMVAQPRSAGKLPLDSIQPQPTVSSAGPSRPAVDRYASPQQEMQVPVSRIPSLGGLQPSPPAAPQLPTAQRYDEVAVPLHQPQSTQIRPAPPSPYDALDIARQTQVVRGATVPGNWKTGLVMPSGEQRVPFDLVSPHEGVWAMNADRDRSSVVAMPMAVNRIRSVERANEDTLTISPADRVRQFIREPQQQ